MRGGDQRINAIYCSLDWFSTAYSRSLARGALFADLKPMIWFVMTALGTAPKESSHDWRKKHSSMRKRLRWTTPVCCLEGCIAIIGCPCRLCGSADCRG